jgi:hypothetical protein
MDLVKAYQFFRSNSVYAEGALKLAKAELISKRLDWEYQWIGSDFEWDGDSFPPPKEILDCILRDATGKILSSLCCIGDPDNAYMRFVEAELALEALANYEPAHKGLW